MSKPNIILTGFMATGKTTVGRLLAAQMGYDFVDTDHLIEARSGLTIPQIFHEKGEAAFREMEAALARELSDKEGLVISTGGRLMLNPDNAALLSRRGRVFCLVATPEEIMKRVEQDTSVERPLLTVSNPKERIIELIEQRKDDYGRFPQMMTSDKIPEEVAKVLSGIILADPDLRLLISAPTVRYEFIVGSGLLPFVSQLAGISGPIAVIFDRCVGSLYTQSCGPVDIAIEVPPGQQHKTLATVRSITQQLVEKGFDRSGTIIALGGSVISELVGFVAATYMRGVDCVQCPTSLLAMVDTSIGGKASINLPQGKNLIGAFKQPKAVIADVATLRSLPSENFAFGMAEIIKHSLIADPGLLEKIENGDWKGDSASLQPMSSDLQILVAQAIQVKINIVQEDPFEKGRRVLLNLGHTFAHAIEQVSGHSIHHGKAVAMGLVAAAHLSHRLGFCSTDLQSRIETTLEACALPTRIPHDIRPNRLFDAMRLDKKKTAGHLRFVLLRDVGDVFVTNAVTGTDVLQTLNELIA